MEPARQLGRGTSRKGGAAAGWALADAFAASLLSVCRGAPPYPLQTHEGRTGPCERRVRRADRSADGGGTLIRFKARGLLDRGSATPEAVAPTALSYLPVGRTAPDRAPSPPVLPRSTGRPLGVIATNSRPQGRRCAHRRERTRRPRDRGTPIRRNRPGCDGRPTPTRRGAARLGVTGSGPRPCLLHRSPRSPQRCPARRRPTARRPGRVQEDHGRQRGPRRWPTGIAGVFPRTAHPFQAGYAEHAADPFTVQQHVGRIAASVWSPPSGTDTRR